MTIYESLTYYITKTGLKIRSEHIDNFFTGIRRRLLQYNVRADESEKVFRVTSFITVVIQNTCLSVLR